MKYTPPSFKSTVLAQKLLSNNISETLETEAKYGSIGINSCGVPMSNISTIPTFYSTKQEPLRSDFGLPIEELISLLARKAKSVYEKMLISERGQSILIKAFKYKIDFDKNDIDFLKLIDEIDTYESLIQQADDLNISWDMRYYDPTGLQQEIEVYEHAGCESDNEERNAYFASR